MCALCTTTAALTAVTATATTTAIATWSLDLGQSIIARFQALLKWLLWSSVCDQVRKECKGEK